MTAAFLALALAAPARAAAPSVAASTASARTVAVSTAAAAPPADEVLPAPPPGRRVDYRAARVDYDADKALIRLSTGAVLRESSWTVKGDDLLIDVDRRIATSDGPVILENSAGVLSGKAGEFDLGDRTGTMFDASGGAGEWRIHGREARLYEDDSAVYRTADFTSCDRLPPHYHFHATSVKIVPRSTLSAWNILFYLGDVPIFYFPYFYRDLSPEHFLRWRLQPGYDRRNGEFIKSTLVTPLGRGFSSTIYADYYLKEGFGAGGELNYRDPKDASSAGGIYGYNIRENPTGLDRWTLIGSDYQSFASSTAFQGRLQLQSDPNFNNDYARSNLFRVSPELVNSAAVDKRFDAGFAARVIYARDDILSSTGTVLDQGGVRYVRNTESLPRLEFQTESWNVLDLPWLNSFSGYADNNYDLTRGFTQKSASGQWEATRGFTLLRGVTLTPRTDVSETGYDRFDDYINTPSTTTVTDVAIARWTTAGDLRFNTRAGNVDVRETYAQRLRPGAIDRDIGANDHGIEQNDVQVSDLWMPLPSLWARLATGFDNRVYNDHALGGLGRIEPVVGEATWTPSDRLTAVFRNDYKVGQGERALIADFSYAKDKGPAFGAGFEHNLADPQNYYQNFNFTIAPSSASWKLIATARTVFDTLGGPSRLHGLRLYEKDLAWIETWHDFITKVVGAVRPGGVGEISFAVSLRLGPSGGKTPPSQSEWERQFFPEAERENDYHP